VENNRLYRNEINLLSVGDGPVQWVGGLYQYYNHYDQPITATDPNQPQFAAPPAQGSALYGPGPANPNN